MKQKYMYITVGIIIMIFMVGIIFISLYNKKGRAGITEEIDKKIQVEKNVSGITQYALSDDSLKYVTRVEYREISDEERECIIVEFEDVDMWKKLTKEIRVETMEGLINTSRLQIDREFGCVVVESLGNSLVEGFWRDAGGYVIIEG